ncbi:MAG: LacI family transcriptional regulator [Treponema sp.]|jgi:LacI family transcriptional regulator|nr:LacI family transcriptional regulator [Treponema sp.]
MRKTIKDVAYAAGVSTATVSRALAENPSPVAEQTRLRVIAAADKLSYRMNHTARSLKVRSTMTVAVVFPELANDFFMDVAEGIERELDAQGYTMLLSSSRNSVEEEQKRIAMLADRMVDGMVIIPAGSRGEHLRAVAERTPVLLVDRIVEGPGFDAVVSDNEDGTRRLTNALLSDGFRRIAFVGGEITVSTARERLSGYARALAEAGIQPEPSWICLGGMNVEDGYQRMKTLMEEANPPEAMVAVNLLIHLGMERRLLDMDGPKPPVVIAGFDESRYTPFLPASRYTAFQDAVAMGRRAGQRIIENIREKKTGRFEREHSGERIIRLPVTIHHH